MHARADVEVVVGIIMVLGVGRLRRFSMLF